MGAVLSALAAALIVAGCGGGNGDESSEISKPAFVEKGGAICVATRRQIRSDFEAYRKGPEGREIEKAEQANELTPEEAAAKVGKEVIVPVMKQELEEFRALGIPPGGDNQVTALLDAFAEGIEAAERHPERVATDGSEAFGKSGRLADDYGLEGC
ncbi:MAG TPA: hypothetical protein VN758_08070 [Solirubrobacterales bacterium]|nr:hypothetical protein [Solirubrobacterales bacterium]